MKIKIGNKIYSANSEPILVILDETDKFSIFNTSKGTTRFCAYPDSMRPEQLHKWLTEIGEK